MSLRARLPAAAAAGIARLSRLVGPRAYRDFVTALWEQQRFGDFEGDELDVSLHCPAEVQPDPAEAPLIRRIFDAYRSAKAAQAEADPRLLPGGGWSYVGHTGYAPILEALERDDPAPLHYFLANFRIWKQPTGIVESSRILAYAADPDKRRHYERRIVAPLVGWWLRAASEGRGLEALALPRHGNPGGALVNGQLVDVYSIFSEVHGRLVADLVPPGRPLIAELGGGFGQLCTFLRRQLPGFTYAGFDLPETLCCASYFLLRTFPDARFLLHGEGDLASGVRDHDFVLRPSFELWDLEDETVDLFLNENSLGAMPPVACELYVKEICRVSSQFWHRNHEIFRNEFADHERSLVNREYPISPAFTRVARYPDVAPLIAEGRVDYDGEMVWYHYRRDG